MKRTSYITSVLALSLLLCSCKSASVDSQGGSPAGGAANIGGAIIQTAEDANAPQESREKTEEETVSAESAQAPEVPTQAAPSTEAAPTQETADETTAAPAETVTPETTESIEADYPEEVYANPVSIVFPAHQYARNQYNGYKLDIEPFTLTFALPEGWSTALPDESEYSGKITMSLSAVRILDENGSIVGSVDYNTYELNLTGVEGELTEIPYRAVYGELMLPNHATWDCEYTVVKDRGNVNAATCKSFTDYVVSESGEDEYAPAALAYNSELSVYVSFIFHDGSITDEERTTLARSVDIFR